MAQIGYTPISIYYSSTAGNTPTAGNLVAGELAINTADGKLFYKDSAGVVQVIAGKGGAGVAGGSNTQVQYNSSGSLAGSANFVFDGSNVGIGTASPSDKLQVTGGYARIDNSGSSALRLYNSTTQVAGIGLQGWSGLGSANDLTVGTVSSNNAIFMTGLTERMRITSAGNVGIGTASPATSLAIVDNATAANTKITISRTALGTTATYSSTELGTTTASPMDIITNGSTRMRIDSSGNVGIGTNNPQYRLAVVSASNQGVIASYNTAVAPAVGFSALRLGHSSGTDAWQMQYDNSTGYLNFYDFVAGANRLTINSYGNVALAGATTSAPGVGITFPATQSASSDANCLDDYEEGTWTPGFAFGGNSVGMTYQTGYRTGNYVKVGNKVTCTGIVYLSAKGSSTGAATVTGLPFTNASGNAAYTGPSIGYVEGITYTGYLGSNISPGASVMNLWYYTEAGANAQIGQGNFSDISQIRFSFSYITA